VENGDSSLGRNCLHRRSSKAAWVASDDEGATGSVGGRGRDAILEIGTRQLKRLIDDRPVDSGNLKNLKKRKDCTLRLKVIPLFAEQIVEGSDGVRGKTPFGVMLLNHSPQRFASLGVWFSPKDDIEENIRIEEDAFH
jgi:hypothetical protein